MRRSEPKPDVPTTLRRRFPDPNSAVEEMGLPDPYDENYEPLEKVLWILMIAQKVCTTPWLTVSEIYDTATDWLQINLNQKSIIRALARAGNRIITKKAAGVRIYSFARPAEKYLRDFGNNNKNEKSSVKKGAPLSKYGWHDRIKEVSEKQYQDGHYKEAIQNALVEVIDQVKIRASNPGRELGNGKKIELDGDDLMNRVFGCDNQIPTIKFNGLNSGLDKAEQRGIMNLFKGIVGVRDKKAHLNYIQNDKNKAIEYLCLASLLMRLLEEGTVERVASRSS